MEQSLTDKVVEKIRGNINNGTWKTGEYIPPMRVIAEQEGVSRGVVTAAISILVGKGMLKRIPRHGMKVSETLSDNEDSHIIKNLAKQCQALINLGHTENKYLCTPEDLQVIHDCLNKIVVQKLDADERDSLISYEDIVLYDKGIRCAGWSPDRYTLYKCNLTRDDADLIRGNLLNFTFDSSDVTFDDRTMDYVEKRVHPNDAGNYLALINCQFLISKAAAEDYSATMEYREKINENYRWVRLNLNASKDSMTSDIILYLLYQDIDDEKRNELILKERTDEDALTGALNRRAFMLQSEQLISESDESRQHAFLMLDVDGFKAINDMFGHPIGDAVLNDMAKVLHTVLRYGDLFGRIGGDEFMICLRDIPFDAVIEKKAAQINELMRRSFDNGAFISGSIGIAVFPRDGTSYDQLYSKADMALYHAKESGKNRYEFYRAGMNRNEDGISLFDSAAGESETALLDITAAKKKILIVDDIETNRNALTDMISDEYIVLQAKDSRRALLTLRRYGTSISAVLLNLLMPQMDGFEILRNMQQEPILKSIPVIIVGNANDTDSEFKAIEMGATDFISMPVEQRLLKLRIKNSVNKQENERLRIQNSYLQLQGEEEQRYRHIVKSTGTIVIEHDWVNTVFTYDPVISQYLAGTYDHRPLWRVLLSDMVASSMDVKAMQSLIYNLANSHTQTQASLKIQLKTNSGEKHWFAFNAIKIVDDFNITNKLLITLNDINDDVLVEERLRSLVENDPLTGIYNRNAFLEKADEIIKCSQSGKWMLSIIDIDGFKVFNHLYGHDEGDRLLNYLANQLSMALKRFGGVCGRLQADTFAALHPAQKDYVLSLSEARDKALNKYSSTKKITSCTGRCYIDDIEMPINTIFDRAMLAHKMAKNGLNRDVLFTNAMQQDLLHEQKIICNMEQALADGQFCLYFQPIFEYSQNRIVTAEALVRWITPDGKIIPPNEFIPIFEQNGFIVKLDAYVWEKACEYMRKWIDQGINIVPISVNVSRMDIYSGKFVETVTSITEKYDIPPSLLRLEITESAYMKNSEQIIMYVEELQNMGYIIEMDDFGSGFSSLNILSEVPVDILKLDMKFILGKDRTGRKSKIMGHIIDMAKCSDIDVIAEGVETFEQAELLTSLGCFTMQGYYFSKPVKNTEFLEFLRPAAVV